MNRIEVGDVYKTHYGFVQITKLPSAKYRKIKACVLGKYSHEITFRYAKLEKEVKLNEEEKLKVLLEEL